MVPALKKKCYFNILNDRITNELHFTWGSAALHSMIVFVYFPSGALNPLSAAAAAAAAAGRVALAGQAGSSGVLLVSNLNEEVSNTCVHTQTHTPVRWDRLSLKKSNAPTHHHHPPVLFFDYLSAMACRLPPRAAIFTVLCLS